MGWPLGGREGIGISDSSISKQLDIECIYHLYIKCGALSLSLSSITVNVFHILAHTYNPPSSSLVIHSPILTPHGFIQKEKPPPFPPIPPSSFSSPSSPRPLKSRGTTYIQSKVEIFFRFLLLSPNVPPSPLQVIASGFLFYWMIFFVCVCVLIPYIFYIDVFGCCYFMGINSLLREVGLCGTEIFQTFLLRDPPLSPFPLPPFSPVRMGVHSNCVIDYA